VSREGEARSFATCAPEASSAKHIVPPADFTHLKKTKPDDGLAALIYGYSSYVFSTKVSAMESIIRGSDSYHKRPLLIFSWLLPSTYSATSPPRR